MLMQIKQLLIERSPISLTDLSRHFHVSEGVMESMLEQWIKKGRVIRIENSGSCNTTCGACSESSEVKAYYQWQKVAQKSIFVQQDR